RFTPGGGHITVVSERVDGAAQISVHDDGIGIPADAQARIFELFAQEGVTLAHATGGLGVGPALARQPVTLHGGTIEVDSAAADGAVGGGPRVGARPAARPPRTPRGRVRGLGHGAPAAPRWLIGVRPGGARRPLDARRVDRTAPGAGGAAALLDEVLEALEI